VPEYQDQVVHVTGIEGTVIATYEIAGVKYVDVRVDDHIYEKTPEANWRTVVAVDE
jgi:hypothetical protein